MTAPNLTVNVEPLVSGNVTYLPLGAPSVDSESMVMIALRLEITNNYSDRNVKVTGIKFDFPSSSVNMKNVNHYGNMDIGPGDIVYWSNGRVDYIPPDPVKKDNNCQFLPAPGPANVTIRLTCEGYSDDFTITKDLVSHKSPTGSGSYLFPYSHSELESNEYFTTEAQHWSNGGEYGSQIFNQDIGVVGLDPQSQKWSGIFNTSDLNNEDYRIWGKSIRAIADGEVKFSRDTYDENTIIKIDGEFQFPEKPVGAPDDWGMGNYISIEINNTELINFCHLQKGSIPNSLKLAGAKVKVGEIIGKVGNTGHSTNPHTHIECMNISGALRPFPYRNTLVVAYNQLELFNTIGMWVRLEAEGVPKEKSAVCPLPSIWLKKEIIKLLDSRQISHGSNIQVKKAIDLLYNSFGIPPVKRSNNVTSAIMDFILR